MRELEDAGALITGLDRLTNDFGYVFRSLISSDRGKVPVDA